ncbi:hypothetical protein TIFTF001_039384 [Ficus carica]|uniref:Uncharacterized protein n=1 Tax=Ficus carica TaxID=3494 RepID=A0AA88JE26_FICCA|nr:hypothetical protein TIFTF001_039384 [Ficus carica]
MGGELRCEIAQKAYIKLVLHALKHKTSGVNGVLIGRVSPQNDAKNIGDHISRYFPQAAILLLDNKKLAALEKSKDRSPVMQLKGIVSFAVCNLT